ncbi:MAG: DUF6513 domain-containing protein [Pirellulales bacterium]
MPREHIHFVTGKLAATALRAQVESLARRLEFDYSIDVLPITVAALMTPRWIAKHWQVPETATRVLLPGYCGGPLDELAQAAGRPVDRGPKDLRNLPQFFGRDDADRHGYGAHNIQIIAEINHAPRLDFESILRIAQQAAADGADLIDVGCDPGEPWSGVGECVRRLRDAGLRTSIDSLNPREIEPAVRAGAELVLSVNSSNRDAAADWGCEVVVIPDDPAALSGFDETIDFLAARGVPYRLDPILEPIGCGFAASLGRYLEVRRRHPQTPMMMGIGNITELTDADSGPLNTLLLGFCQETNIGSVLTTQVINWARTSVRECDLARRLVHYAVQRGVPPKHLSPELVTLRDPLVPEFGAAFLDDLARQIRDSNYRLFAERGELHLVGADLHLSDADPFLLFEKLQSTNPKNVDPSHAFYLGYELAKAATALTLGKEYRQDESLNWGFLTIPETSHRERKRSLADRNREGERPTDGSAFE